ncbi:MAG TPA: methyltransferase domain-containing protein [Gemmatimonadaceae bacterium]
MNIPDALAPARRRGIELLDDPSTDVALATRSLQDVARSNRWFGGASAVLAELVPVFAAARDRGAPLTLLDVGTGAGDIPELARRAADRVGARLHTMGLEVTPALAAASRSRSGDAIVGDALALPFADRSVDIVACSQVLHHFEAADGARLLAEMNRVARVRVVVADLRRAWAAAAGFWIGSWALRFHPVSRHDGVVSVLRGFRAGELAAAVLAATGCRPSVRNRRGFRVTASWTPA